MTPRHPFRFGVMVENTNAPDHLLRTARRAEQLGYDTLLLRDHFIAEPFGEQFAPMVALATVATATDSLRIGTLVLANDYRHPVMLAKEAATLDALSQGRFELGIGAGWLREEYERAGMPFESPGRRVDRLEESLVVLKGLFQGGPVSFDGKQYSIRSLTTFPPVEQHPHPPILLGAGSQRMLKLAGREADTVGILAKALPQGVISGALDERTAETMERKVGWIRDGAGARFDEIELSMMISPVIMDDARAAADRYVAEHGWGHVPTTAVLDMPAAFLGPVNHIAETMYARRERYGFSYYVVSDANLDTFAPVVDKLTGR